MVRRTLALVVAVLGLVGLAAPVAAATGDEGAPSPLGYPVHAVGVVPSDPLYPYQWGPKKVGMENAWDVTTGASSTVIAIVDTGVDATRPDLVGKLALPQQNFVPDGMSGDPYGHGTEVARTAVGIANNGTGVAGYCWQCRILSARVLDSNGQGWTDWVADGINWAAANGADIINLSLAGHTSDPAVASAVASARAAGIVVVAATGNYVDDTATPDLTAPQYPAALPGVVSVAASDTNDQLYWWSFRGSWAQVAGPGCTIVSTSQQICGTSFASPAVAGMIGLGMSVDPAATDDALINALYTTTTPRSGVTHGRVDAQKFVTMLSDGVEATRVAGTSRINTAIALSQRAFPSGAPAVVLARADKYADALAAAPLAAAKGASLLLTSSTNLSSAVKAEIDRLGATEAWLIGGDGALSSSVESGLAATTVTAVHRVAGGNRYDTAGAIGELVDAEVGGPTVYVASAGGFADAVAVSNLAAKERSPILLVTKSAVPQDTLDALGVIQPSTIVVVGGTGVVDQSVLTVLGDATGATVERVAGTDRYDTSRQVAERAVLAGLDPGKVWVATGQNWPDALAAGPGAAAAGAVLLLTNASASMVNQWLDGHAMSEVVVAGGVVSVSDPTMYAMQAHLP